MNELEDLDGVGTFSYQWYADGEVIDGATNATYTPVEADESKTIYVVLSYTDNFGTAETVTSNTVEISDGLIELQLVDDSDRRLISLFGNYSLDTVSFSTKRSFAVGNVTNIPNNETGILQLGEDDTVIFEIESSTLYFVGNVESAGYLQGAIYEYDDKYKISIPQIQFSENADPVFSLSNVVTTLHLSEDAPNDRVQFPTTATAVDIDLDGTQESLVVTKSVKDQNDEDASDALVTDNGLDYFNRIGVFTITFSATDSFGAEFTESVTVTVHGDLPTFTRHLPETIISRSITIGSANTNDIQITENFNGTLKWKDNTPNAKSISALSNSNLLHFIPTTGENQTYTLLYTENDSGKTKEFPFTVTVLASVATHKANNTPISDLTSQPLYTKALLLAGGYTADELYGALYEPTRYIFNIDTVAYKSVDDPLQFQFYGDASFTASLRAEYEENSATYTMINDISGITTQWYDDNDTLLSNLVSIDIDSDISLSCRVTAIPNSLPFTLQRQDFTTTKIGDMHITGINEPNGKLLVEAIDDNGNISTTNFTFTYEWTGLTAGNVSKVRIPNDTDLIGDTISCRVQGVKKQGVTLPDIDLVRTVTIEKASKTFMRNRISQNISDTDLTPANIRAAVESDLQLVSGRRVNQADNNKRRITFDSEDITLRTLETDSDRYELKKTTLIQTAKQLKSDRNLLKQIVLSAEDVYSETQYTKLSDLVPNLSSKSLMLTTISTADDLSNVAITQKMAADGITQREAKKRLIKEAAKNNPMPMQKGEPFVFPGSERDESFPATSVDFVDNNGNSVGRTITIQSEPALDANGAAKLDQESSEPRVAITVEIEVDGVVTTHNIEKTAGEPDTQHFMVGSDMVQFIIFNGAYFDGTIEWDQIPDVLHESSTISVINTSSHSPAIVVKDFSSTLAQPSMAYSLTDELLQFNDPTTGTAITIQQFGNALSLSNDGTILAVGAPNSDITSPFFRSDAGVVVVYQLVSGLWTPMTFEIEDTQTNTTYTFNFLFGSISAKLGSGVQLSEDGSKLKATDVSGNHVYYQFNTENSQCVL